jgi:uncharacterized damage-inducible protein DinB
MRSILTLVLLVPFVAVAGASPASAQTGSPVVANAGVQFNVVKNFVIRAAEKVPEDLYSFRATPEVRSFGELFGHVADGFFSMCSAAAGTKSPHGPVEKVATKKADLVKALNEGADYCASVMKGMTDARSAETVPFYFGQTPRLSVLYFAVAHGYEHYGNIVTYMRLNKMVPPSSEAGAPPAP